MVNHSTEQLRQLTTLLLSPHRSPSSQWLEVQELSGMLKGADAESIHQDHDISAGETRTAAGLAISPTMASMCVNDFVRTIEFLRGTHAAITDLREQIDQRPVRVLYVGCGPHATLALPLMTMFTCQEAVFTLLDIHPASICSAKQTVVRFGLEDSVTAFETVDAATFLIQPDNPPDLILLEVMQACLEAEPQVALTGHLLSQAPQAVLVPQEVRLNLTLVNPSREFATGNIESNQDHPSRDRISIATVFVLNRETVDSWADKCHNNIPAASICMPTTWGEQYQPMLFTEVQIYKDHLLKDYDSGLSSPRTLHLEAPITPGATIDFTYELGEHPRLVGSVR